MRVVLVAIGLVILLAVGWVLKGLMSDRDERDFAVHYSWIVKWALTLSRETQLAPAAATFDSPRIVVVGDPNRWLVSGNVSWRDALDRSMVEPYAAVVENICQAYADPKCWLLQGFAVGEAALDLAEAALGAPGSRVAAAQPSTPSAAGAAAPTTMPAPAAEPAAPMQTAPDPVLSLLDEKVPVDSAGAVPQAPPLPLARGTPVPEHKPVAPFQIGDEDSQFALAEAGLVLGDADSFAAIAEASLLLASEADTAVALADAGAVATDGDSAAALGEAAAISSPTDTAAALADVGEHSAGTESVAVLDALEPAGPASPSPEASIGTLTDTGAAPPGDAQLAALPPPTPAPAPTPSPPAAEPPLLAPEPDAAETTPPTPLPQPTAPAQAGADAALVALLQDRLERAGYSPGPVDGRYGARTQAALQRFERDAGLPVTGQPTRLALAALDQLLALRAASGEPAPQLAELPAARSQPAAPPPAPTLPEPTTTAATPARAPAQPTELLQPSPGAQTPTTTDESLIFLIQHRLRQAGFSPGRFDGRMSEGTANAIRAYQSKNGLAIDGAPSRVLLERLEADILGGSQGQPFAPTPLGSAACEPGLEPGCPAAGA